ncbi:MAG: DUF4199 domain-containing protein [Bacteroidota bacterium]
MTDSNALPNYWPSVLIASLITGLIISALGIASGYLTIASEPAGSSFNASSSVGILACLLGAIAGVIVNWHYAKEHQITYKIGKGALLGFLAGLFAVIISTVVSLVWTELIDANYNQALYDWQMANIDAQNVPEETKEMSRNFVPKPGSPIALATQFGVGILGLGIMNVISGIIGAKIFASEKD